MSITGHHPERAETETGDTHPRRRPLGDLGGAVGDDDLGHLASASLTGTFGRMSPREYVRTLWDGRRPRDRT